MNDQKKKKNMILQIKKHHELCNRVTIIYFLYVNDILIIPALTLQLRISVAA